MRTCFEGGILVKVILENCYLTDEEKITACNVAEEAGADYVTTSTGFAESGATLHDIELMYRTVGPRLGVKAAGGTRPSRPAWEKLCALKESWRKGEEK